MKNPAAQCSGVLAWVERREVEKRRMMQNTAHGFRVCIHIILDIAVELVKKIRTFYFIHESTRQNTDSPLESILQRSAYAEIPGDPEFFCVGFPHR